MINAKQELIEFLTENQLTMVCADIEFEWYDKTINQYKDRPIRLPFNFTAEELESFYTELDFEYEAGYGVQHLFGTIWLDNGEWLERYEYDGSEHWEYKSMPMIPDYLIKDPKTQGLNQEFQQSLVNNFSKFIKG